MPQTHTTQQTSYKIYWKRHKRVAPLLEWEAAEDYAGERLMKIFFFLWGRVSTVGIGEFSCPEFGANPGIGGSSLAEIGGFW